MKNNTIKIAAIGDSITYGYPYDPALSWLNLAAEGLNIDYINRGVNGDTTDGMLNRFDCDVLRYKPSHVIIMGGTNDARFGLAVDQVINNIRDMVGLAVQKGVIPILGLPIPYNELAEEKLLEQYRAQMHQYAVANHVEIIDFNQAMVSDSGLNIKEGLHCDGVHPSTDGYEVMASVATQFFIKILIATRVHAYYWNEDLSCVITTLKILSEIFHCELHPQVIEAAYGLNAGRLASQCGLVEGALMFIGVYGQQNGLDSQDIAKLCDKFSCDFQAEFGSVLCNELRPQGFSSDNPPHLCENVTKRTVVFSAEFISKETMLSVSLFRVQRSDRE